jgi:hypothetical protein
MWASISGAIWCGQRSGFGAFVGERPQALVGIAQQPPVEGAAVDPVAGGDVGDRSAVEHLSDGVIALLNHRELHQHCEILLGSSEHK